NFDTMHPGQVLRYSLADGSFQGRADTTGFDKLFAPRGLVLGPDGLLYVSVTGNLATGDRAPGYVVRFQWDTATSNFKFKDVFVASDASNNYAPTLHRPEGLVFGPDGNLYVTTFLHGSELDVVVALTSVGLWRGRAGGGASDFHDPFRCGISHCLVSTFQLQHHERREATRGSRV